jgi:hypothetical protein
VDNSSGLKVNDPKLTFVTKTITYKQNDGNVLLGKDFRPVKLFPETLSINFFGKSVINKFGFANPGLAAVLSTGVLQDLTRPFFISVSSVSTSRQGRIKDFQLIKDRLREEKFTTTSCEASHLLCGNALDVFVKNVRQSHVKYRRIQPPKTHHALVLWQTQGLKPLSLQVGCSLLFSQGSIRKSF